MNQKLIVGKRRLDAFMEAMRWRWKFDGKPETVAKRVARLKSSNERQLAKLQAEIQKAVQSGDTSFFKDFAFFLPDPWKLEKRLHRWLEMGLFDASGKQVQFLEAFEIADEWKDDFPNAPWLDVSQIGRAVRELGGRLKHAHRRRKRGK